MEKLFIIGNGFDLAHKLPTKYSDFRKFLISECKNKLSCMPETYFDRDGDTVADRERTAGLLINLIDEAALCEDWKDMEEALGRLNYYSIFEDYDMAAAIADDDDDEMFRIAHIREDTAYDTCICVSEIKRFFSEWVDSIEITRASGQTRFKKLFKGDSGFLTFNYTRTLENVYGITASRICHIHGEQGGDIIVGHGATDNPYIKEKSENFAIDKLGELFNDLRKDVCACYNRHISFFQLEKFSQVKDIYSFGFSFSDIDCFYISCLCRLVDTKNVRWHLAEFDEREEKNERYKQIIIGCGFKGGFGDLIADK